MILSVNNVLEIFCTLCPNTSIYFSNRTILVHQMCLGTCIENYVDLYITIKLYLFPKYDRKRK